MKYTTKAIQSAYSELERRRQSAMAEQAANVSLIEKGYPEIYSVYCGITNTAKRLAEAVFSKEGNTIEKVDAIRRENLAAQEKLSKLLTSFGFPQDFLMIKYSCPKCFSRYTRML